MSDTSISKKNEEQFLSQHVPELAKEWLKELKNNPNIKTAQKQIEKNSKDFLSLVLNTVAEGAVPKIKKEEFAALKALIAMLQEKCLGLNCPVQDMTSYIVTLKTAFIKFLQQYYQNKKFEMHPEFQDFANLLDIISIFIVQNYAQVKETEIKELRKNQAIAGYRGKIIGASEAMYELFKKLQVVVDNDVTVLLEGESGTGKELLAQAVHYQGARNAKPFVAINCAAIPETLIESELFGYAKGAFTGADTAKPGKFETADQGTIFLDEISELTPNLQAKLLRVLQERQITRLGSNEVTAVDVRIISATNKNLLHEVRDGRFREDLYYRLAVFPIKLPPLRERGEDILLLAEYFLNEENAFGKKKLAGFSENAKRSLLNYSWPGNIRELQNVVKRAYLVCTKNSIDSADLMFTHLLTNASAARTAPPSELTLEQIEQAEIKERLKQYENNMSRAARSLGITRATLYKKLRIKK